jgi:hypothetical protein
MRNDGCTWLHGGLFFIRNLIFFLQQKLVIIVLKLQLCDLGWKISRGSGLKVNNKVCNAQHNVGLVLVFSG